MFVKYLRIHTKPKGNSKPSILSESCLESNEMTGFLVLHNVSICICDNYISEVFRIYHLYQLFLNCGQLPSLMLQCFVCPVGWWCRMCRLCLSRRDQTHPIMRQLVGGGWWPVMLQDRILVAEQYVTRLPMRRSHDLKTIQLVSYLRETDGRKGPIRSIDWSCQALTVPTVFFKLLFDK